MIEIIEKDGWYLKKQRGSHRQFVHPEKKGKVTVPGKLSAELATGTENSIY